MAGVTFPYPQARRGQLELAKSIADIVKSGGSIVVKAPTGYGKTVSVVYGLLLGEARRVLYVVRTINEIDPVLKEIRNFNERYSILVSARRTCPIMSKPGGPLLSHEDFWRNCTTLRSMGLCKYYLRIRERMADIEDYISKYPLPRALKMLRDIAGGLGVCPFFSMIQVMGSSRFIVATYPYIFRPDIAEQVFPEGLGDYVLVVDEAHSLLNAQSIVERRVTLGDLARAALEIRKYSPENSQLALALEDVKEALSNLRRFKWSGLKLVDKSIVLSKIEDPDVLDRVETLIRSKLLLEALISRATSQGDQVFGVTLALSKVVEWVKTLKDGDYHLFAGREGEELILISTPLDPVKVVKKPLESVKALIMLSGTIPQGDFLRGYLGVERSYTYFDVEMLFGPLMPRSNIFTVVVADVTSRFKERSLAMYDRIARYVERIARSIRGVKLIVYPSYEFMNSVIERLPGDLKVIVEDPQTNIGDIEAMIVEGGDVLVNAVAGGKLVEGVEFMDYEGNNLLHLVAIVGIPFPQPDDYSTIRLEVLSKRMERKEASKLVYPISAIIKVRQALGRATRSPGDRAAYILLDYRYLRRDIKELLALRYDRVVANIEEVNRVLEDVRRHLELEDS